MNLLDFVFFTLGIFWLIGFAWGSIVAYRANRKEEDEE